MILLLPQKQSAAMYQQIIWLKWQVDEDICLRKEEREEARELLIKKLLSEIWHIQVRMMVVSKNNKLTCTW